MQSQVQSLYPLPALPTGQGDTALMYLKTLWVGSGREGCSALLSIHLVRSTQGQPPTTAALLIDLHLIQRHAQVGYPSLPPFITPLRLAAYLPRSLPFPSPTATV